jgi:glutaminyl-peptide cyclotransferase
LSSKANRLWRYVGIGALLVFAALGGCQPGATPSAAAPSTNLAPASSGTTSANGEHTPAITSSNGTPQKTKRPKFDGDRAFVQLKKQCDFGPRYLGSEGHEKCRDYFVSELKKYADEVVTQDFTYRGMPLSNVIGVFHPAGATKPSSAPIVLLAHWDTRPIADGPNSPEARKGPVYRYGPKGWNRINPIPGANDGASGAAVLLELARLFKEQKPPVGVLLLFVDGEDYGDFRQRNANNEEGEGVFLGSRYFAANFRKNKSLGQPVYGILLDMVGGKNLVIPRERESQQFAPGINERVFSVARSLGYGDTFRYEDSQEVTDDHIPLNMAGIPTIDLIHPLPDGNTGYYYWHTLRDVPENCSARSLKIVGEVLAEVVYSEAPGS